MTQTGVRHFEQHQAKLYTFQLWGNSFCGQMASPITVPASMGHAGIGSRSESHLHVHKIPLPVRKTYLCCLTGYRVRGGTVVWTDEA